ncbi:MULTISPECIES: hypothetical protein [Gordonia]|uniref:hypothetical protein n=1 Tax=Gordonia TaxID=2053 RepID=UPI0030C78D58
MALPLVIGGVVVAEVLVYLGYVLAIYGFAWMVSHPDEVHDLINEHVPGAQWIEDQLDSILKDFLKENKPADPPTENAPKPPKEPKPEKPRVPVPPYGDPSTTPGTDTPQQPEGTPGGEAPGGEPGGEMPGPGDQPSTDDPAPGQQSPGGTPGGDQPGTDQDVPGDESPDGEAEDGPVPPVRLPNERPDSGRPPKTAPDTPDGEAVPGGDQPKFDDPTAPEAPGPGVLDVPTVDSIRDWLAGIILSIAPDSPDPDAPPTDRFPDVTERDDINEILTKHIEELTDFADEINTLFKMGPQKWGTYLHQLLELSEILGSQLQELVDRGYELHFERSVAPGEILEQNPDGSIRWKDRHGSGTRRPDLIVTRFVDGIEEIVLVVDLKTGNARMTKTWIEDVGSALQLPGNLLNDIIRIIRAPGPVG